MKHIFWSKPVFYHLLGLGVLLVFFPLFIGKDVISSYSLCQVVFSIILGAIVGIIVCLAEIQFYLKKGSNKYRPTQLPYYIQSGIIIAMIFLYYQRVYVSLFYGGYLLALAFVFRAYENKVRHSGSITWKELLSE